ncbi:hypothetical protein T01_4503 [Trichinella spiralis]|uniref:Uncharacterized protein n=1 Tax=Trichinella spiralis TaxID=6334 RepID=A0A0V1B574_TRISP|nr:hypothetical protein T01_4503 [Trichinella spiralis]
MDACWTYVLSRLTYHLTVSKFPSIKQSTAEYNRTLDADQALLSMETFTDFESAPGRSDARIYDQDTKP